MRRLGANETVRADPSEIRLARHASFMKRMNSLHVKKISFFLVPGIFTRIEGTFPLAYYKRIVSKRST